VRFDGANAATSVGIQAVGNGGDIEITTGSLALSNGAQLSASTLGEGNAGNVTIQAGDTVSFDSSEAFSSAISLFGLLGNGNGSEANGGNISIEARSLSLINGSLLQANTYGRGDAGNVLIRTSNSISLADNSRILTNVESYATGNGGDITIQTGSLSLTNGSRLNANTSGRGDAGNLFVQASNSVSLADNSRILTNVEPDAIGNGGDITIQTGSLSLTGGSDLQPSTFGRGNAGNVTILASGSVFLEGVGSDGFSGGVFSNVDEGSVGNNGNINIQAGSLFLTNGAVVSASTSGQGNGGNVRITVRENISLDGVGSNEQSSGIFSNVCCKAVGKGGEINIQAGSLSLTNGAEVGTTTFGQGDSGNIAIAVRDTISLDGVGTHGLSSGVFSDVNNKAVGNGGEINIQAGSLSLSNGAAVNASTYGKGNGGNISLAVRDNVSLDGVGSNEFSSRIVTQSGSGAVGKGGSITVRSRSLSLTNDAQISANAVGFGKPGNIQINAAESVKLKNSSSLSTFNAFGNLLYGADARGNLRIQTGRLIVQDGSDVTVSSGFGDAGNIEVTAHSIELDNKGKLMAQTVLGSGGNITLNVQDLLLLRRNSQISATSTDGTLSLRDALSAVGFTILGVDGGNITINAPFIVAVPKENSDITANAFEGRGGRVRITTQGLFGIQPRPRLTPLSDITASSDLGVDGEVTVNGPDVDPSRGLAELPNDVVDATKQIDRRCTPSSTQERSRFIITGRGGLPPSPNEPLQGESVLTNWVTLDSEGENNTPPATTTSKNSTPRRLAEAQGWMINDKGQVVLTASAPQVTPQEQWLSSPECNPPRTPSTP
jgi:large exoprotein involved in heme utilization and adhesion